MSDLTIFEQVLADRHNNEMKILVEMNEILCKSVEALTRQLTMQMVLNEEPRCGCLLTKFFIESETFDSTTAVRCPECCAEWVWGRP